MLDNLFHVYSAWLIDRLGDDVGFTKYTRLGSFGDNAVTNVYGFGNKLIHLGNNSAAIEYPNPAKDPVPPFEEHKRMADFVRLRPVPVERASRVSRASRLG
ncbi:hypothetical protein H4R19_004239 [Coemansia spiralis]|nr:hypothetical protein H4R19_004239 [Coemansia spiralis]